MFKFLTPLAEKKVLDLQNTEYLEGKEAESPPDDYSTALYLRAREGVRRTR
jgi:hypothetical protein